MGISRLVAAFLNGWRSPQLNISDLSFFGEAPKNIAPLPILLDFINGGLN